MPRAAQVRALTLPGENPVLAGMSSGMTSSYLPTAFGSLFLLALVFMLACLCVAALLALPCLALQRIRVRRRLARRRLRCLLPADWWTRFERDLRAYESAQWTAARRSELGDDLSPRSSHRP